MDEIVILKEAFLFHDISMVGEKGEIAIIIGLQVMTGVSGS
jgi:hypothetical protein